MNINQIKGWVNGMKFIEK